MAIMMDLDIAVPEALQPQALLAHPRVLAQHLRALVDSDSTPENIESANACILDQIHTEAIPSSVYIVWLFLVYQHSPLFVPAALQHSSWGVRSAAITVIRRRLFRGAHWKVRGWDLLGGARGIKSILDDLPLKQMSKLLQAIFLRTDHWSDRGLAETCIEELVTLVENSDQWTTRPITQHIAFLYGYCTTGKVVKLLRSEEPLSYAVSVPLGRFQTPLLRSVAIGEVDVPSKVRRNILTSFRGSLLGSRDAYAPIYAGNVYSDLPPGIAFGADMLQLMGEESDLQNDRQVQQWIDSVLVQAFRNNLPFEKIMPLIISSLKLSRSRKSSNWLGRSLPRAIMQFWSQARFGHVHRWQQGVAQMLEKRRSLRPTAAHQDALEQCLIEQVLQVEDRELVVQGRRKCFTGCIVSLLGLVDKNGRLEFLRLICRHSPVLNFDLKAWPPSEEERRLVPVWNYDVLCMLRSMDSKVLFERSLHIHQCEDFIPKPVEGGRDAWNLSWEQQCQFWADWESSAAKTIDDFPITFKAIDEMKRSAMRAREPPERLRWAKSAISLAVEIPSVAVFGDLVEWIKRFLRDPLVFPDLIDKIFAKAGRILSCRSILQSSNGMTKESLVENVTKAHQVLRTLLEISLLLLREPWARKTIRRLIWYVPNMFNKLVTERMGAVKKFHRRRIATEAELVEILLDPLIPTLLDYEREGNQDGQKDVMWSGQGGVLKRLVCPDHPSAVELSFVDRIAKARNEFWEQHRARTDPEVLTLGRGWPRGLPIQSVAEDKSWLYHALERPSDAPYLASKADDVLFGSLDTVMTALPENTEPIDTFVDSLGFAIRARIAHGEPADKVQHLLRIWEHYSSILHPHPLYLELFGGWLASLCRYGQMNETADTIQPPVPCLKPMVSPVPTGPGIIEWDPQESVDGPAQAASAGDEDKPKEIPCTILNCRLGGRIPTDSRCVRTRQRQPKCAPPLIWSDAECQDKSVCVRDSVLLAALLFLDTYTKGPRLLRAKFPDVEHPRFTPVYLADEFIARAAEPKLRDPLHGPVSTLEQFQRRVPSQILRGLIWSFLDTLQAEPNAPMYPKLLFCTLELTKILLRTDQPHLAIDVVLRVWKDFANESSCHRQLGLLRLGRILPTKQAGAMMQRITEYVCDALKTQQQQGEGGKLLIKVTTAKMLAQALAAADFLPQSARMHHLQTMYNVSNHLDIRQEIMVALLELVSESDSAEPYKVFASIALSAAGPNERVRTTEEDWDAVDKGGPLPYVAPRPERPILDLVVSTAVTKVPMDLKSDYVQKVVLPLLEESTRKHTRWMRALVSRIGLSLSDLGLTELEIGPFSPGLIRTILHQWKNYLPGSYLQREHRSWSLKYLHYASFNRIAEALITATHPTVKEPNVRDHWDQLIQAQRLQSPLYCLTDLLSDPPERSPDGITDTLVLEDYAFRAEIVARNPFRYNRSLGKYIIDPGFTLGLLQELRSSRTGRSGSHQAYFQITHAMRQIVDISNTVRKEGWSTDLADGYPVTVPTAFEHEIKMLPSPAYNPDAWGSDSVSELDMFIDAVIRLIRKYVADPVLLLNIDALHAVMRGVVNFDKLACALRLGSIFENGQLNPVEVCVRVRLAAGLLKDCQKRETQEDQRGQEKLVEEWKGSEIEMVRLVGWEV